MLMNAVQAGIIVASFSCPTAWSMQTPFELQIEEAKASFAQYLDTTEQQLASIQAVQKATPKALRSTINALTSFASSSMGYGNVTADEMRFMNRLFEDKEKKQAVLEDFLKNHAPFAPDIKKIFFLFQKREKIETKLDPKNLLIEVLHQQTVLRLKQPVETTTRAQMAQAALDKDAQGTYIIPDKDYYPAAITSLFATHMFEKFFKG